MKIVSNNNHYSGLSNCIIVPQVVCQCMLILCKSSKLSYIELSGMTVESVRKCVSVCVYVLPSDSH